MSRQAGGLPKFVVRAFEAYLECELLDRVLVHLRCVMRRGSRRSVLVQEARILSVVCRVADGATPPRTSSMRCFPRCQCVWVCSLPWRLQVLLGYDRALCSEVLSAFTGALARSLAHRAKAQLSLFDDSAQQLLPPKVTAEKTVEPSRHP